MTKKATAKPKTDRKTDRSKTDRERCGREKTGRETTGSRSISTRCKIVHRRTSVAMPAIGFAAIKICRRNSSAALSKMIGSSEGSRLRSNTGC